MKDLVILGTGGHAREVHQLIEDVNAETSSWNVLGFLDDNFDNEGSVVHNMPVLGSREWLADREVSVALGIGGTPSRARAATQIVQTNPRVMFPALVHPSSWLGNRISIGNGSIICAGSLLTTDLRLGAHVIVNLDCTVAHDCDVGDFVTMAPSVNISGAVRVGEGCDLGIGASIIQGLDIGSWSIVGAGAVVVRDLPPNVTAVGVPAKPISEREQGWQLA